MTTTTRTTTTRTGAETTGAETAATTREHLLASHDLSAALDRYAAAVAVNGVPAEWAADGRRDAVEDGIARECTAAAGHLRDAVQRYVAAAAAAGTPAEMIRSVLLRATDASPSDRPTDATSEAP